MMTSNDNLVRCVEFLAAERVGADRAQDILSDAGADQDMLFATYRDLVNKATLSGQGRRRS